MIVSSGHTVTPVEILWFHSSPQNIKAHWRVSFFLSLQTFTKVKTKRLQHVAPNQLCQPAVQPTFYFACMQLGKVLRWNLCEQFLHHNFIINFHVIQFKKKCTPHFLTCCFFCWDILKVCHDCFCALIPENVNLMTQEMRMHDLRKALPFNSYPAQNVRY